MYLSEINKENYVSINVRENLTVKLDIQFHNFGNYSYNINIGYYKSTCYIKQIAQELKKPIRIVLI